MNEQTLASIVTGTTERELQEQLEKIRNEEIPERLLELARQLQAHLRQIETSGK